MQLNLIIQTSRSELPWLVPLFLLLPFKQIERKNKICYHLFFSSSQQLTFTHTQKKETKKNQNKVRIDYEKWELILTCISTITGLSLIDKRNVSFVVDGIIFCIKPRPNWNVWEWR